MTVPLKLYPRTLACWNCLRIWCGIFTLFHRRNTMLDSYMATVTADELLMNRIHSEQEMENRLELFATFALRSTWTHHNQHLNEIECFRTHTWFIKLCCGVGKRHRKRGPVIITIRVRSGVQSFIVLKSFLVRHFHGAINWMEVHKILNYLWIYLFIKMRKRSFPYHINHPFFHEYHWVTLTKKHTSYIPPQNQKKKQNKKLCILKYFFYYYFVIIVII